MGVARAMVLMLVMARTIWRAGFPRTRWGSSGAWHVAASGRDLTGTCTTVAGTWPCGCLGS